MLFPICRLVVSCLSCKCDLLVVSEFVPDVLFRFSPSCLPLIPRPPQRPVVFQGLSPEYFASFFNLVSNCVRAASQMWSSNCLPFVTLSLEAVGLQSWVDCVCLLVSHSPDFSCCGTCFLGFPSCVSRSG